MSGAAADRNLLLGIIALQMDFISRDALIAAMNAWVLDKATALSQILQGQGALTESRRSLLDALVEEHLKLHEHDIQKSLGALRAIGSVRDDLARIADPDLHASLPQVSAARGPEEADGDPFRTQNASVGESTSPGLRFRILRPHARGGLGQVSVALDTELDRPVALKQIQDRYADDQHSRARFVAEAEITGKLEHPGIIPVYGLGHYADGRPFYAMRFVKGDSLMEAIAGFHGDLALKRDPGRRTLRLRELLRRFQDVCDAIAYAHSRGVLHRDLKPGNIMLGPYGETLVVDWGLAKPMGQEEMRVEPATITEGPIRLSGQSGSRAETVPGSLVGTPAYASPEQVTGRWDLLKPASDVYSLGATLYTLLTGLAPIQGNDLEEVLRRVKKGEIPAPRSIDPTIPQPLEAICLKALALEAEQRYETAEGLKADLERWLADEPVTAWREPLRIRARRWMRRHRTLVTASAAVLLFGMAGLAGFATVVAGKNRELDAKNLELVGKNRELDAKNAETKAVLGFFQDKVLAAARPRGEEGGLGIDATIRAAMDAAEPGIERSFADQPTVRASIRDTLGLSYYYLGEPALAISQFEPALALRRQSLGVDHPDTINSMGNLAAAYHTAGRLADALPLYEEALKRSKAKLGPDHRDTLTSMVNLAGGYRDAGRIAEALPLVEETLHRRQAKLGPDHPDTLLSMNNLAGLYWREDRFSEALPLFEETFKRRQATLGPDHPRSLTSMNNLAQAYQEVGRPADALPLFEVTMKRMKANVGPDHPYTLSLMNNLACAYRDAGRLDQALPLFEETLKRSQARLRPDHPNTLNVKSNLARTYLLAGKPAQAEPLLREALAISEKKAPDEWPTFETRSLLGGSLLGQHKYAEAEPLLLQGYEGMRARVAKIRAPNKKKLNEAGERIVELYGAWGKEDKAQQWRKKLGEKTAVDKTTKP